MRLTVLALYDPAARSKVSVDASSLDLAWKLFCCKRALQANVAYASCSLL